MGIFAASGIIALIVGSLRVYPDQLVDGSPTNRAELAAFTTIFADVAVTTWYKYVIRDFAILKANNTLSLAIWCNFG